MSLQNLELPTESSRTPDDIQKVVTASRIGAREYIENRRSGASGFVPSDPEQVYHALRAIGGLLAAFTDDVSFCEWGSGLGTVTCLASKLGFDACGIEIEPELVAASREFADRFELPAEFAHGSFVPQTKRTLSIEAFSDNEGRYPWLNSQASAAYTSLGREPESFDIVFAYPWPGEEYFISRLFSELASPGALLLSYGDNGEMNLSQKPIVGCPKY